MPEPTFLVRRSARSRPVKVLRDTTWRYSSFFRNSSSKRWLRSSSMIRPVRGCFRLRGAVEIVFTAGSHRLRRLLQDVGDDLIRIDPLRLSLEGKQYPVAERRRRH